MRALDDARSSRARSATWASVTCHGQGRVRESKKFTVKIPAGVDNGDRVRLSGEGEAGMHGGGPGDLYVQVSVKTHAIFERHENDLYCEVLLVLSLPP